eukprot:3776971-Pyramimonas_sp.AAC.1
MPSQHYIHVTSLGSSKNSGGRARSIITRWPAQGKAANTHNASSISVKLRERGLWPRGRIVEPAGHDQHIRELELMLILKLLIGEDHLTERLQGRRRRRHPVGQLRGQALFI